MILVLQSPKFGFQKHIYTQLKSFLEFIISFMRTLIWMEVKSTNGSQKHDLCMYVATLHQTSLNLEQVQFYHLSNFL